MKSRILAGSCLICVLFCGAAVTYAGEGYVFFDATYNSKYVWRGVTFVDASVLQPYVTVGCDEFSVTAWGSIELTNENTYEGEGSTAGDFTEADIFIDHTCSHGVLTLSKGLMYCSYPNSTYRATSILYVTGSLGIPLNPTLSLNRDIGDVKGFYGSLGISHTIDGISPSLGVANPAITLSGSVGYANSLQNMYYRGVDKAAPADLTLGAAFSFTLADNVWLTPSINHSMLLDSEIKEVFEPSGTETNTWFGVSLTWQPI
jgi:hypothetical protein